MFKLMHAQHALLFGICVCLPIYLCFFRLPIHPEFSCKEDPLSSLSCLVQTIECDQVPTTIDKNRTYDFLSEEEIIKRTGHCSRYFKQLSLEDDSRLIGSESNFPLAFGIGLHHQVGILEMFLRTHFHPEDSYCIHVDAKADKKVFQAASAIINCYKEKYPTTTIFVSDLRVPVYWGTASVLEMDLLCLRQLEERNSEWKMFLNPAASELPLVPLQKMKAILRNVGDSVVEHFPVPAVNLHRFEKVHGQKRYGPGQFDLVSVDLPYDKEPPPFNLTIMKGSKNVALSKMFAYFLLNHNVAWQYLDWVKSGGVPDEHFYSTLATVDVQGTEGDIKVVQNLDKDTTHGICIRYSEWDHHDRCQGQPIHGMCNFATGDLPRVRRSSCLMVNKFNLDVDPVAVVCQTKYLSTKQIT